jgi:membrane protease subunit HflC
MNRLLVITAIIAIAAFAAQSAFIVPEGEQALVFRFGKHDRTIPGPGLYLKNPLTETVKPLPNKILAADARSADDYMTLDKKRVIVDMVSRWRIADPLKFYLSFQSSYHGAVTRLNDLILANLRQEIGNHNFREFVREKRERIMEQVTISAREQAIGFGIDVIDVRIKKVDLPEETQNSVFARMKAERERSAKRYRAEGEQRAREIRANANKERDIILADAYEKAELLRGEGDAAATAIYAEAYGKNPELYSFLRSLDVYKKVFGAETHLILKTDSDLLRYLQSPDANTGASSHPAPR